MDRKIRVNQWQIQLLNFLESGTCIDNYTPFQPADEFLTVNLNRFQLTGPPNQLNIPIGSRLFYKSKRATCWSLGLISPDTQRRSKQLGGFPNHKEMKESQAAACRLPATPRRSTSPSRFSCDDSSATESTC